jgi:hypothetical protein
MYMNPLMFNDGENIPSTPMVNSINKLEEKSVDGSQHPRLMRFSIIYKLGSKRYLTLIAGVVALIVTTAGFFYLPELSQYAHSGTIPAPKLSDQLHHSQFRVKPRQDYSSVHCRTVWDDYNQCLFSNVAIRSNQILFYEDPDHPIDFITNRVRRDFPGSFVGIRGGSMGRNDRHYFDVVKMSEAIPKDASYLDSDVNVLQTLHYPDNIGHLLGEVGKRV